MKFSLTLLAWSFTLVLQACVAPGGTVTDTRPAAPPVPPYLLADRGCAVMVGGSVGDSFKDPKIASFWFEVNRRTADRAFDQLVASRLKVHKLTIAVAERAEIQRLIVEAAARHQCNRLIQLANSLGQTAAGNHFEFTVSVMRLRPNGQPPTAAGFTPTTTVGEFERKYRHPLTPASFDTISPSGMAQTMVNDLLSSSALDNLR